MNVSPVIESSRRGRTFQHSLLHNVDLIDLYGDGTLAAYSSSLYSGDNLQPQTPNLIYRLMDGMYTLQTAGVLDEAFFHGGDLPDRQEGQFQPFAGSQGPYVLRMVNGFRSAGIPEQKRIDSGRVLVNGVEVLTPADFRQRSGIVTVPLTNVVPGVNTVTVELHGKADGAIDLVIEDHTPLDQNGEPVVGTPPTS